MDLGWWFGHMFEVLGIAIVGASLAYDLHRGRRSRPQVGDQRASEIVATEEAFLGARVHALMVTLAAKDTSTEEHTRRAATLAVEIGEQMSLSRTRLRSLAIGGLLHDIGKLSIPDAILQKPGPLDDEEFAVIKTHPERGRELLEELGGFDESVSRLVLDHHERHADPRRVRCVRRTRLAACLPRCVAGRKALAHLQSEADTSFDARCVTALILVLAGKPAEQSNGAVQRLGPLGARLAFPS
jgi:HD-GYP domain-containing protein (c-di-GMP phosphodiesterase class II)